MDRRTFLGRSARGAGWLALTPLLARCGGSDQPPLLPTLAPGALSPEPDENGLRLPEGFTSRIIARTGDPVGSSGYRWHQAPDGGATFPTDDGGWVYVSNSEFPDDLGGVGAIRFARDGEIVDAYSILQGTSRNCAGGPTPWGTWFSCEEVADGLVYECDPLGDNEATVWPALGSFRHEAAAVDPNTGILYLTEDEPDGLFYRFVPDSVDANGIPSLDAGRLEAMGVDGGQPGGPVRWYEVPDPAAASTPTRSQVPEATAFDGGEGLWFQNGEVYFTTKGDNRVWCLDVAAQSLRIVYDAANFDEPVLTGVDNVLMSPRGDILVAEDGGDMQVVALTVEGQIAPLLQVVGHELSEITGPAFSPDGRRFYFSSQRGIVVLGITYEVTGPFFG